MAMFKCKMCGGTLDINEGATVCECEYCGTTQTLPKTDNEKTINMLNRASHFRQQCEFDKAMEIYEKLLDSSDKDSEIYWQIVLCRYGIEYVDDPLTKKKIPTCHRTQFNSILNDVDYLEALNCADSIQRDVYIKEAEYIDNVQKGILETSNKEEPFDIFICYKESDENGKRTHDSVLAQDLYYQLEQEGFKVFFSRITLEGKLGTAYEPYIFAALNSSKVMVVVGTKQEYFNAVWVKNEWSRYLVLMQNDRSKTIIPAYKDMDPYDLPDALSMFQAQDMSKLGFMQDLIRGIKKLTNIEESKKTIIKETVITNENTKTVPLLKRAFIFLEDGEWSKADDFCEQVLNNDPECAKAYLGKLLAELKLKKEEDLFNISINYANYNNYKKYYRFSNQTDQKRLDENQNEIKYLTAENLYTMKQYQKAHDIFNELTPYKESEKYIKLCLHKLEDLQKRNIYNDEVYQTALSEENKNTLQSLEKAIQLYESIPNFKDVNNRISKCKDIIYNTAVNQQNMSTLSSVQKALDIYKLILDWKDTKKNQEICKDMIYNLAEKEYSIHFIPNLEKAINIYKLIPEWRDSNQKILLCEDEIKKIKENYEIRSKKGKKDLYIALIAVVVIIILALLFS